MIMQHVNRSKARHTFASTLLSAGVPVPAVAEYLGHSPAVLLSTYAHLMPADHDRARSAVRAAFGKSTTNRAPRAQRQPERTGVGGHIRAMPSTSEWGLIATAGVGLAGILGTLRAGTLQRGHDRQMRSEDRHARGVHRRTEGD